VDAGPAGLLPAGCGVDAWLVREGRLDVAASLGALTQQQARLLGLAAERAARLSLFGGAARLLRCLALRSGGAQPLRMADRRALITRAELWAQAAVGGGEGSGALGERFSPDDADNIRSEHQVLCFQDRLASAAEGAERAGGPPLAVQAEVLSALRCAEPRSLDVLFNDAALPLGAHGLAVGDHALAVTAYALTVEMFAFSGIPDGNGGANVRTLWDRLLEAGAAGAGADAGADARLASACEAAASTGAAVYPSPVALPLAHVALRLEQLAAGLWPPAGPGQPEAASAGGNALVSAALLRACRGNAEAAAAAVRTLLDGAAAGGERGHPELRAHILRSALHVCRAWAAAPGLRAGFGRLREEVEHYLVSARTYGDAGTATGLGELQAALGRA